MNINDAKSVQTYDEMLGKYNAGFNSDDLVKALSTTQGGAGITSGALMLENLDSTMTEVLIEQRHFKLFNKLPRVPSTQPNFEYNVQTSRGTRRGNLGFAQGAGPTGSASTFVRRNSYVKYLGVLGAVTHQMGVSGDMGGTFVNPEAQENKDRTIELLESLERQLLFGDSTFKDKDGIEVNIDGFLKQLTDNLAANVIDLQGAALSYDNLDESIEDLITNGKLISVDNHQLLGSPHVVNGLNKQYQERNVVRHNKDAAKTIDYVPGFKVPGYDSQFGFLPFDHSILMEEVENSVPATAAHADAPAAPGTVTGTPADDATGLFVADDYFYFVAAFNDSGESLPTASASVTVSDSTSKVTLAIARVTGATGYRVYRAIANDATTAKWIGKVVQPNNGDAAFVDRNFWRTVNATTGKTENGVAVVFDTDPRDLCVAQMAPMMKMRLPQGVAGGLTTFPFMLLLYITMVLKAPARVKIYKNCGVYTPPA